MITTETLRRFDYHDPAKDAAMYCPCGMLAPAEIVEYYRLYHVLGCRRCRRHLGLVDHPASAEYEFLELFPWSGVTPLAA